MPIEDYVPHDVLALRTEANLNIVNPWFEKSLDIPGDVAEIGCFRGTMSIKYAFWIRALELPKMVLAFDTFGGFQVEDRSPGGLVRIGDYSDNRDSYKDLLRWRHAIPVYPVIGDARWTIRTFCTPLSFVWLDLDIAELLRPVTERVLDVLADESTIIGLDDYGRPECPTVKPWADEVEAGGRWRKLFEDQDEFIAFYQRIA